MGNIETFTSFTTSNCYVVTPDNNSKICYIIDLPPDVEPALEYVKNNNLSIGGCLLTHGHFDHSLGMEKVDGEIYINLEDEFLARNPQEQLSAFTNSELEVQEYTGELNDIFTYKNENIIIYSNPGHTKGSVSYEFKNLGVVFTGDFVFAEGIGRTDLYSGSTSEMKESINNIFLTFNKDLEVFPGHGNTDTVKNILNYNSYLKEFINCLYFKSNKSIRRRLC